MDQTTALPDAPVERPSVARMRPLDVAALALLALVVRLPAALADRALSFDDGVFANSAIAMREGGVPFRDVFSSQGPLFLPMVYLGDLVGLRTLDAPRVLAVVSGLVAVVAVYWTAIRLTDRVGALLSAGLVATSGGLAWVTGPLAADGPALAFAAVTMGLTVRQRDEPSVWRAALIGAALGAVLSTKSLEAPIIVPVALVLGGPFVAAARWRRLDVVSLRNGAVAIAASAVVFLTVSVPLGMADVWDQSVVYRTEAAADRDIPATAGKLLSTLWDRDLALLCFAAVALVSGILRFRRSGRARVRPVDVDATWSTHRHPADESGASWAPSGRLLATSWLVTTLAWLVVVVAPLWRPHVAAVSIPLALVVGIYRPALRTVLVTAAVAVPLTVVQLDGLLVPDRYEGTEAQLVAALEELPPGAWVISDEPGVVWRAGRRTTDDLVDPSMLRREQGRYTERSLAAAAEDPRVCAFVRISEQRFAHFDGLPDRLLASGFEPVGSIGDGDVLYVRADCSTTG